VLWRKAFIERGPELFVREATVKEYERRTEPGAAQFVNLYVLLRSD